MTTPSLAVEHDQAQRAVEQAAVVAVLGRWARVGDDFDAGWSVVADQVTSAVAAARIGAARTAGAYVGPVLAQVADEVAPAGRLVPEAFGTSTADGRPLASLLGQAPVRAKQAVAAGATSQEALAQTGRWLGMVTSSEVADAGRSAASVEIAARPRTGWVRQASVPCCARCGILAGRWYRWNQGFQRHPRCDCRHIPAPESVAGDLTTDPARLYREGKLRGLTAAQRRAVDDGADLTRVVNATRGMSTATVGGRQVRTTTASARKGRPRLVPESVYEVATDRDDALRLLAANGYLA